MTRKIKKILFVEEGWLSVFLKPTIQATKMGDRIEIEFTYKYNWLGCFTLNIVQLIFDFFYYGLSQFNIKDYFNTDSHHKVICGIKREFLTEKELEYLQQFPPYPRVVKPDLSRARIV
jgi:hypothetical protein